MIPNFTEENSEAYFYFSLADFEEIIKEYGVQFCFEKMSPNIKEQLLNFFKENISSNNKEICSLLKKNVS